MKKLILLLSILFSVNSYCQINLSETRKTWIGAGMVSIRMDGKIYVEGDSLSAIKALLRVIDKISNEREEAFICVDKSAKWSNTVPYHWKKNKQWQDYLKSISKQGFSIEK